MCSRHQASDALWNQLLLQVCVVGLWQGVAVWALRWVRQGGPQPCSKVDGNAGHNTSKCAYNRADGLSYVWNEAAQHAPLTRW